MGNSAPIAPITIFIVCLAAVAIGIGAMMGRAEYPRDTFDCTNTCKGLHSIFNGGKCYCEATK